MNVSQVNQKPLEHAGKVPDSSQMDQAALLLFQGELQTAQENLTWTTGRETIADQVQAQTEELQEEHSQELQEKEFQQSKQNQANLAQLQSLRLEQRKMDGMSAGANSFHSNMDSLSQRRSDAINQEKVMGQRGHLFNPALAKEMSEQGAVEPQAVKQQAGEMETQKTDTKNADTSAEGHDMASLKKVNLAKPDMASAQMAAKQPMDFAKNLNQATKQVSIQPQAASSLAQAAGKNAKLEAKPNMAKPMENSANFREAMKAETGIGKASEVKGTQTAERFEAVAKAQEVAEKVRIMINTQKSEMIMKISPEHLGKMEVKLNKEGDKFTAQMKVQSVEAKNWLEAELPELRESLLAQGVEVSDIKIQVEDNAQGFAFGENAQNEQNSADSSQRGTDPALNTGNGSNSSAQVVEEQAAKEIPTRDKDSLLNLYA